MNQIKDIMNQYRYIKTWIVVLVVAFNLNMVNVFAQAPQTFKYQSVIRDLEGRLMAGTQVGLKLNIIQGNPTGSVVYEETYTPTTNNYGLVNLDIGAQDPEYFSSIDWSDGPYFIEISIDILGGVDYKILGASELMSVPYALYALHAKTAEHSIDTLYVIDTTSPPVFSGSFIANVADDYGAIGDGVTSNTLAFNNAFAKNNDIFVPASDSTYLISSLSIPENKRIWFERGAKLDVSGTLTGTNTEIIAGQYQIFTSNSSLAGTWKGGIAYEEWLGADNVIEGMQAMVTAEDTTRWGDHIFVSDSVYGTSWNGNMHAATKNAIYDKIETLQGDNGSNPSAFIVNVVDHYGAVGDGSTDNKTAFTTALSENNDIFVPNAASTYRITKLTVPKGKRLWFEGGSVLDIEEELIIKGEIVAGLQQIFSIESASKINADSACFDKAYPEWFGAQADNSVNCRDAIQSTLNVFKTAKLTGNNYKVAGTINFDDHYTLIMNRNSRITPSASSNSELFNITKQPFNIEGGTILPEPGYNNWIFHVRGSDNTPIHGAPQLSAVIRDVTVYSMEGYGNSDYSGDTYKGIWIDSDAILDYTYYGLVDNVQFYRSDTAVKITSSDISGLSNAWRFDNLSIDWCMRGIYIDKNSLGHVFSNLQIQNNTLYDGNLIRIEGTFNQMAGVIWDLDTNCDTALILGSGAYANHFSNFGLTDFYTKHVQDNAPYKTRNIFSTSNPFEPTSNGNYNYYTTEKIGFGIDNSCYSGAPSIFVASACYPVLAAKRRTSFVNGSLSSTNGAAHATAIMAQTSANMFDGFGTGILFLLKDNTTDSNAFDQNVFARIYARRDGSDNRGALQFFTRGNNASSPTLTLRNSGKVGLNGVIDPSYDLDLGNGTFQSDNIVDDGTKVTFGDILKVTPRSSAPSSPTLGTIYVNSSNKHIYYYNGSAWKQLD